MNAEDAQKRMQELVAEAASNPARAAELAPELKSLARVIQGSAVAIDTIEPPIEQAMCVAHDQVCRKHHVCKKHQICNAHPKGSVQ